MTSHITPPDQSERAGARIAAAILDTGGQIDHATARLIASTLHAGPNTALEQFAATGRFNVIVLTREVRMHRFPSRQEVWRDALLAYLEAALQSQPWMRDSAKRQARHMSELRNRPFSEGEPEAPPAGSIPSK